MFNLLCKCCDITLTGRQTKFCSTQCKYKFYKDHYIKSSWVPPSGPDSPTWKGGFKYWSQGRFGCDKDGLSWKVQRRLAWERDAYKCQKCTRAPVKKPDVHHIIPWRLSLSHSLDNLICLCKSCHKTEDSKIIDEWYGAILLRPIRKRTDQCLTCKNKTWSRTQLCKKCRKAIQTYKPKLTESSGADLKKFRGPSDLDFRSIAFPMRVAGKTCAEIASVIGMSRQGVAHRFRLYITKGILSPEVHSNCNEAKRRRCQQCNEFIEPTRRRPSSLCCKCDPIPWNSRKITNEQLLLESQTLSPKEISHKFGCDKSTIYRRLRKLCENE